jgi:hypothetical protein
VSHPSSRSSRFFFPFPFDTLISLQRGESVDPLGQHIFFIRASPLRSEPLAILGAGAGAAPVAVSYNYGSTPTVSGSASARRDSGADPSPVRGAQAAAWSLSPLLVADDVIVSVDDCLVTRGNSDYLIMLLKGELPTLPAAQRPGGALVAPSIVRVSLRPLSRITGQVLPMDAAADAGGLRLDAERNLVKIDINKQSETARFLACDDPGRPSLLGGPLFKLEKGRKPPAAGVGARAAAEAASGGALNNTRNLSGWSEAYFVLDLVDRALFRYRAAEDADADAQASVHAWEQQQQRGAKTKEAAAAALAAAKAAAGPIPIQRKRARAVFRLAQASALALEWRDRQGEEPAHLLLVVGGKARHFLAPTGDVGRAWARGLVAACPHELLAATAEVRRRAALAAAAGGKASSADAKNVMGGSLALLAPQMGDPRRGVTVRTVIARARQMGANLLLLPPSDPSESFHYHYHGTGGSVPTTPSVSGPSVASATASLEGARMLQAQLHQQADRESGGVGPAGPDASPASPASVLGGTAHPILEESEQDLLLEATSGVASPAALNASSSTVSPTVRTRRSSSSPRADAPLTPVSPAERLDLLHALGGTDGENDDAHSVHADMGADALSVESHDHGTVFGSPAGGTPGRGFSFDDDEELPSLSPGARALAARPAVRKLSSRVFVAPRASLTAADVELLRASDAGRRSSWFSGVVFPGSGRKPSAVFSPMSPPLQLSPGSPDLPPSPTDVGSPVRPSMLPFTEFEATPPPADRKPSTPAATVPALSPIPESSSPVSPEAAGVTIPTPIITSPQSVVEASPMSEAPVPASPMRERSLPSSRLHFLGEESEPRSPRSFVRAGTGSGGSPMISPAQRSIVDPYSPRARASSGGSLVSLRTSPQRAVGSRLSVLSGSPLAGSPARTIEFLPAAEPSPETRGVPSPRLPAQASLPPLLMAAPPAISPLSELPPVEVSTSLVAPRLSDISIVSEANITRRARRVRAVISPISPGFLSPLRSPQSADASSLISPSGSPARRRVVKSSPAKAAPEPVAASIPMPLRVAPPSPPLASAPGTPPALTPLSSRPLLHTCADENPQEQPGHHHYGGRACAACAAKMERRQAEAARFAQARAIRAASRSRSASRANSPLATPSASRRPSASSTASDVEAAAAASALAPRTGSDSVHEPIGFRSSSRARARTPVRAQPWAQSTAPALPPATPGAARTGGVAVDTPASAAAVTPSAEDRGDTAASADVILMSPKRLRVGAAPPALPKAPTATPIALPVTSTIPVPTATRGPDAERLVFEKIRVLVHPAPPLPAIKLAGSTFGSMGPSPRNRRDAGHGAPAVCPLGLFLMQMADGRLVTADLTPDLQGCPFAQRSPDGSDADGWQRDALSPPTVANAGSKFASSLRAPSPTAGPRRTDGASTSGGSGFRSVVRPSGPATPSPRRERTGSVASMKSSATATDLMSSSLRHMERSVREMAAARYSPEGYGRSAAVLSKATTQAMVRAVLSSPSHATSPNKAGVGSSSVTSGGWGSASVATPVRSGTLGTPGSQALNYQLPPLVDFRSIDGHYHRISASSQAQALAATLGQRSFAQPLSPIATFEHAITAPTSLALTPHPVRTAYGGTLFVGTDHGVDPDDTTLPPGFPCPLTLPLVDAAGDLVGTKIPAPRRVLKPRVPAAAVTEAIRQQVMDGLSYPDVDTDIEALSLEKPALYLRPGDMVLEINSLPLAGTDAIDAIRRISRFAGMGKGFWLTVARPVGRLAASELIDSLSLQLQEPYRHPEFAEVAESSESIGEDTDSITDAPLLAEPPSLTVVTASSHKLNSDTVIPNSWTVTNSREGMALVSRFTRSPSSSDTKESPVKASESAPIAGRSLDFSAPNGESPGDGHVETSQGEPDLECKQDQPMSASGDLPPSNPQIDSAPASSSSPISAFHPSSSPDPRQHTAPAFALPTQEDDPDGLLEAIGGGTEDLDIGADDE